MAQPRPRGNTGGQHDQPRHGGRRAGDPRLETKKGARTTSQPRKEERIALIGLGIEGEEGFEKGLEVGAEAAEDGVQLFTDEEAWDILEEIPNDSAAALILLEHHWAVPLRDAILRTGGVGLADSFIHPTDLVAIGIASAAEAEELGAMHPAETAKV